MAAPESSPDLSVVQPSAQPSVQPSAQPSAEAPAEETAVEPTPPHTGPSAAKPQSSERRGAPWWLVVVVAVVGVILFLNQYQRAEVLDARVTSLTDELLATDQQLQLAHDHIAAHQTHLDQVRSGVAELSASVAGVQALADRDPLAPPAGPTVEPSAASSAEPTPPVDSAPPARSTAVSPELERSIIHDAVGTPFADF